MQAPLFTREQLEELSSPARPPLSQLASSAAGEMGSLEAEQVAAEVTALLTLRGSREEQPESVQGGEAGTGGDAGQERAAMAATPASAAGTASSPSDTGSDAKVARFLSRAPQVTLARGGARLRRCSSTPEGSRGAEAMQGGAQSSPPARPASARRPDSGAAQQAGESSPADTRDAAPTPTDELAGGPAGNSPDGMDGSCMRRQLRFSEAMRLLLPATAIEVGPALPPHRHPSKQSLDGLLRHHGLASDYGVRFFSWARCTPEGGRPITFAAGVPAGRHSVCGRLFLKQPLLLATAR